MWKIKLKKSLKVYRYDSILKVFKEQKYNFLHKMK